jgi:hypothetical protein
MAITEQLFSVQARQNEIWRRLKAGSLNVDDVLVVTQGILDGIYPAVLARPLPNWYVSPEQQLERVRAINVQCEWGFAESDFPAVPIFTPRSSTEVLLLAVYLSQMGTVGGVQRTFDEHIAVIESQLRDVSYEYWRAEGIESDRNHLRLFGTARSEPRPGLRWVAYDYAASHDPENGRHVDDTWKANANNPAASEVLSALMLFPEYGPSMDGDKMPYANLRGYQVDLLDENTWLHVLYVMNWLSYRSLGMLRHESDYANGKLVSPVVREC